ncbi:MAG: TonB-dependent receptor [Acidobacteria bacterium]|nr:TonB-dependent receptor [Acidobacteriota bacterium]
MYRILTALVVVSLSASAAAAQISGEGTIRGYVRDEQKGALPGVTVTAASPTVPRAYAVVTDGDGLYRLTALQPADYTITAELPGFAKFVRPGVAVRAGLNIVVDIELKIGTLQETVEVKADTPMLEMEKPVQAVNISGDFQRTAPLTSRRDFTDFLAVTPGLTTFAATDSQTAVYFLRGSNLESHVTMVDGADLTGLQQARPDYMNLSTDSTEDAQVHTAASDASAPLGLGVVMNVATGTGTDSLKGAFGLVYTARGWNANNNPEGDPNLAYQTQPDVSLGGPIWRRHAWFFGSYRYTIRHVGILRDQKHLRYFAGLDPGYKPFDNEVTGHAYFVKSNVNLPHNHTVDGFYQFDQYPTETNRSENSRSLIVQSFGGHGANLRLSSVWGSSTATRLAVAYNSKSINSDPSVFDSNLGTGPARPVHDGVFLQGGRLRGTGLVVKLDNIESRPVQPASRLTFSGDLTYYRSGWAGSHEIKTGVRVQLMETQRSTLYQNNGFAQEEVVLRNSANLAAGFVPFHRQIFDSAVVQSVNTRGHDNAVYIQDAWKPTERATFNVGVRVDFVQAKDQLLDLVLQDSIDVGPRFGATYVLTEDRKNVAQFSWGRVHDLVLMGGFESFGVPERSSATAGFRDLYDLNLDGIFETTFVTPGGSGLRLDREIDPDYHQPYMNEWTVGYRRQLPKQVSVDVSFVRRDYRDRKALVETNGIYDGGVFRGYKDESLNDVFLITNNIWNWYVYSGLDVVVAKRTDRIQLIGTYTRGWRHMGGTWQPNDPASFVQPEAFPNDKGLGTRGGNTNSLSGVADGFGGNAWTDHVGRVAVVYMAPGHWVLGTNFNVQAGWYSGPIVTRIAQPDPRFGPATVRLSNGRVVSNPLATTFRFIGQTRGDGQVRAPNKYFWNAHVARRFRFGAIDVEPGFDVFNLMNGSAIERFRSGDAQQISSPNYGKPDVIQAPRAAQFTLRVTF